MSNLIDELKPCRETSNEYVRLWQNVLICALKDAIENNEHYQRQRGWPNTRDCQEVCLMAEISYDIVRNKFKELALQTEASPEQKTTISYFKSTIKRNSNYDENL